MLPTVTENSSPGGTPLPHSPSLHPVDIADDMNTTEPKGDAERNSILAASRQSIVAPSVKDEAERNPFVDDSGQSIVPPSLNDDAERNSVVVGSNQSIRAPSPAPTITRPISPPNPPAYTPSIT